MDFKDLNIFAKILNIILLVLFSPLILLFLLFSGLVYIVTISIEYPKYKMSNYYKKYKEKYYVGVTFQGYYKAINYFKKNNIKYDSFDSKEDTIKIGNTTYLFSWFEEISFNEDGECIISEQDNGEFELLKDSKKISEEKNIKILVPKNAFYNKKDLVKAKKHKQLIVYNKFSDLTKIWEG